MKMCFLADAEAVNTRSWVDFFADSLGHDVHVVSINRVGELSPRVTLHHLGDTTGTLCARGKLDLLRYAGRVRRLVRGLDPDIVVGYRVASYGYLGARTGVRPLAVAAQGQYIVVPNRSLPKRYFARTALRRADVINSWAPHVTRRLMDLGADPDKIITCPRGIDLARFPRVDARAERAPAVVSTRGLHFHYRVDRIVEGLAIASREGVELDGVVAGDGEAAGQLAAMSESLGLNGRVRFLGNVANAELSGHLGGSMIYASAVPSDGVSASLLEAMARGCFPIVRDNDANRNWITDGENGLLVQHDCAAAYAAAFVRAARDEELRERAAELNRAIVEDRGDMSKNLRTIEAAYESVVSRCSAAGSC